MASDNDPKAPDDTSAEKAPEPTQPETPSEPTPQAEADAKAPAADAPETTAAAEPQAEASSAPPGPGAEASNSSEGDGADGGSEQGGDDSGDGSAGQRQQRGDRDRGRRQRGNRRRRGRGGEQDEASGDDKAENAPPPRRERAERDRGDRDRGPRGRQQYFDAPQRLKHIENFLAKDDIKTLEGVAEAYGREWATRRPWTKNKFSTYQIRPVIAEMERLRRQDFGPDTVNRLRMLRPQVAYLSRRYHDDELYEFARVLRHCVEVVGEDAGRFTRFLSFWDALMLYFRANGGR